jgi:hypothetical protein
MLEDSSATLESRLVRLESSSARLGLWLKEHYQRGSVSRAHWRPNMKGWEQKMQGRNICVPLNDTTVELRGYDWLRRYHWREGLAGLGLRSK